MAELLHKESQTMQLTCPTLASPRTTLSSWHELPISLLCLHPLPPNRSERYGPSILEKIATRAHEVDQFQANVEKRLQKRLHLDTQGMSWWKKPFASFWNWATHSWILDIFEVSRSGWQTLNPNPSLDVSLQGADVHQSWIYDQSLPHIPLHTTTTMS